MIEKNVEPGSRYQIISSIFLLKEKKYFRHKNRTNTKKDFLISFCVCLLQLAISVNLRDDLILKSFADPLWVQT